MNLAYKLLVPGLSLTLLAAASHAQEASNAEEEKRVQYQLVLPEEKTPENVKPEEHNPFESAGEALSRQSTGDTEENRVRDKLLKLPVVGTKRMTDGRMRVLLGDIILETGGLVPPVLPEQLVELKVKNITSQYIELAWQEKRATGLPPKLMIIPINIAPQVRYQMLGQSEDNAKTTQRVHAKMNLPQRDLAADKSDKSINSPLSAIPIEPTPPRAQLIADDPQPFTPPRMVSPVASPPAAPAAGLAAATTPEKTPESPPATPTPVSPPPSPAVESVVRMLFGNSTPAGK